MDCKVFWMLFLVWNLLHYHPLQSHCTEMCNWKIPASVGRNNYYPIKMENTPHYPHCALQGKHCLMSCLDVSSRSQTGILQEQLLLFCRKQDYSQRPDILHPLQLTFQNWVDKTGFLGWNFSIWYLGLAKHILTLFSVDQHISLQEAAPSTKLIPVSNALLNFQYLI